MSTKIDPEALTEDDLEEILPHRDFCHECDWWHVGVMLLVADHDIVKSENCVACGS